jgi:hypothetical protein
VIYSTADVSKMLAYVLEKFKEDRTAQSLAQAPKLAEIIKEVERAIIYKGW